MKYKRPTLDKWYFRLNIRKDYVRNNGYIFTFGLFKLKISSTRRLYDI